MIKKSFYEAPETELILVRFEEAFLNGTTGIPDISGGDVDDDSDDWS